jgi:hypothetical protein
MNLNPDNWNFPTILVVGTVGGIVSGFILCYFGKCGIYLMNKLIGIKLIKMMRGEEEHGS